MSDRSKDTSREEVYRDDEDRDIDSGWPYADVDAAGASANAPYGETPAGLDRDVNSGIAVSTSPAIHSEGGPVQSSDATIDAIDDDGLEEEISNQLTYSDDVDEDLITVTVHQGVAKLTGDVETSAEAAVAARIAAAVPGVRAVYNLLVPIAADSHIPGDVTG